MKQIILACFIAAFCITDSLAENRSSLLSDYLKVISNHEKKHGEKAQYDETTYDKEFKEGMLDVCFNIEQFIKNNNLSVVVSRENTDFIAGSKKYNCAHVCDEVDFYYDLMMINFACIVLLPTDKTQSNTVTNMEKIAANYCELVHKNDITSLTVRSGYTRVVKSRQTKCEMLDADKYRCVESAIYANPQEEKRVYGKCCLVNCEKSDKCIVEKSTRPYAFYDDEILTLDDFTKDCILKE